MKKNLIFLFICGFAHGAVAQITPLNAGTVNPNDSIVIYYDVTINNPCGCSSITNQATVSGSNFTALNSDDPDTGTPNDPTITPLNLFPLPVTLTELKAYAVANRAEINVEWKVVSEINIGKYEIERSSDGRNFMKIGEVTARGLPGQLNYIFTDHAPSFPANFYRLKIVETNAASRYTMVVKVDLSGSLASSIQIYPNPVRDGYLHVQLIALPKGVFDLSLYNNTGQKIWSYPLINNGATASLSLRVPVFIRSGMYIIKVQRENLIFSQTLLVQ